MLVLGNLWIHLWNYDAGLKPQIGESGIFCLEFFAVQVT